MTPGSESELLEEARACAAHVRLALLSRSWRGTAGSLSGKGTGSSIDYQDHRPYLPGDDPRHIDWAAYARSGQTLLKLYREETSPRLDLVVDGSASMALTPDKAGRTRGLAYYCAESAASLSASLRGYRVTGGNVEPVDAEVPLAEAWRHSPQSDTGNGPDLSAIPFRPSSLRVVVTDLLYADEPDALLRALSRDGGRGLLLVPVTEEEAHPDWKGHVELVDCETGWTRRQRVSESLRRRYRDAYRHHMDAWRERARALDVGFARVPAEGTLASALEREAVRAGVVEPWG